MPSSVNLATALRTEIERTGYYPNLVVDSLSAVLSEEAVIDYVVQHETTFDRTDEIRRHITVLLLTPARLILVHVDEHTDADPDRVMASSATESVPVSSIGPVIVQRMINDPAHYSPGDLPSEVVLTVSWGTRSTIDLEPATCGDPQCEADHGYSGTLTRDDWVLRVSVAADGDDVVHRVLDFAARLVEVTSR